MVDFFAKRWRVFIEDIECKRNKSVEIFFTEIFNSYYPKMISYVRSNYKFDINTSNDVVSDAFLGLYKRFNKLPFLIFESESELRGYIYQTVKSFANKEYKRSYLLQEQSLNDEIYLDKENLFEDELTEYEYYGETISHSYRTEFVHYMKIFYHHTDIKKFLEKNILCTKLINYFCIDDLKYNEILQTNEFFGKTYSSIRKQYERCKKGFKEFFSTQKKYNRI